MKTISLNTAGWRVTWSPTGNMLTVTTGENKTLMYKQALGSDEWELVHSLNSVNEEESVQN